MLIGVPYSSAGFPCFGTQEIRSQTIEFTRENRGASVILNLNRRISLYFPREQGSKGGDEFANDCFLRHQFSN